MASPKAGSSAMDGARTEGSGSSADKDKILANLANENQLLTWKVSELEETIDGFKLKQINLEDKIATLLQMNNALREQLDAKPSTPRRYTTYVGSFDPLSPEDGPRKRPSNAPPPIPPLQLPSPSASPLSTSPLSSSSESASPILAGTPTEEGWGGRGGWSSGTVGRRDSGILTVNGLPKSRSSAMLNHSSSMTSLPVHPIDFKLLDVREERSKTSPIPAPSPSLVPPYLARAISLSAPALPDSELNGSSITVDTISDTASEVSEMSEMDILPEEEANPDLIFAKNEDNGKTFIKGGTLDQLIERLTYDKTPETDYAIAFLLTYRSFTTPMELLDKLVARYNIEPPECVPGEVLTAFEKKKKIVQLRVGNVVKMWIDKHFHDFEHDPNLVARITNFVDTQIFRDMETLGKTIIKLLAHTRGVLSYTFNSPPPPTYVPKSSDFNDFEPMEVARQLTLIEYDLYKGIEAKECLNQAWSKTDKEERAPHIVAMIKRFNLVSAWVATEIIKSEKLSERMIKVKKFLYIARYCRDIGNFNGVMEILAGLQNSAVHRLRKTWDKVLSKSKYSDLYNSLLSLMSNNSNFKEYRAALHSVHPPCIPYLGVFLTDLTFIEDGTKDTLNNRDDLIHFEKRRKVSVVIRDIQQYQQTPYHFTLESTIKEALITLESHDENTLYKNSMAWEPREAKDAKDTPPSKRDFSMPSFTVPAFLSNFDRQEFLNNISNTKRDLIAKYNKKDKKKDEKESDKQQEKGVNSP